MAGVKVELNNVREAFKEAAQVAGQPAALLLDVGEILLNNTRQRLIDGVDIHGDPFTPLSSLTVSLKKKNKDRILFGEGDLFRELTYQLVNGNENLEFGSDRPYAATQQLGATIKPKNKKVLAFGGVFAKEVTIPSREFIGFTPQDESDVLNTIADRLAQSFE